MLESLSSDLRFGARSLWKSRGFSAIAIITLALGVGASTAIFSVMDNILLEPFPYPAAQRLMSLEIHNTDESNPGGRGALGNVAEVGLRRNDVAGGAQNAPANLLSQPRGRRLA